TCCLETFKESVKIVRRQCHRPVQPLRHQVQDGFLLGVAESRNGRWWMQNDRRAGSAWRPDRKPAHVLIPNILAHLETEEITIETQRRLGVGVGQESVVNGDVHASYVRRMPAVTLLDS